MHAVSFCVTLSVFLSSVVVHHASLHQGTTAISMEGDKIVDDRLMLALVLKKDGNYSFECQGYAQHNAVGL